ncbi:acyl-CoA dehydrogenase family protein [Streptomyces sp. NPDC029041]|uniref:acyl-CoA dehydrogenase family protein n=1 Tax=Streptomyces sp. NPDC029041 TaxID=3155727 RepID=UPI00340B3FE9
MKRELFDSSHDEFREVVRQFVAAEVVPNLELWDEQGFVSREFYLKAAEVGLLGLAFEPEHGGLGLDDFRFSVLINEELARVGGIGVSMGVCGLNDLVGPYLTSLGTAEQKLRWLPGLADGSSTMALALSEPGAGSDLGQVQCRAVPVDGGYLLSGSKTFISNGITANRFLVLTRTDPDAGRRGLSLLVVDANSAGFARGNPIKKIGLSSQDTAELFFNDVFVPADCVLGEPGTAWTALMGNLAVERMSVAVTALAAAEGVFTETLDYVSVRRAFGQTIGSMQYNMFGLASLATELRTSRVFLDHSIMRVVQGELSPAEAAMAKFAATELQQRVAYRCQQLYGGYGYMREYPVARAFVDGRASTIYAGTSEIMMEIVGRDLGLKS